MKYYYYSSFISHSLVERAKILKNTSLESKVKLLKFNKFLQKKNLPLNFLKQFFQVEHINHVSTLFFFYYVFLFHIQQK